MLVFKYLLRVFKYLTIAYVQQPSSEKIFIVINYCAHIRPTWLQNYQKIKDACLKSFGSLQYVVKTQMSVSLSIYSI